MNVYGLRVVLRNGISGIFLFFICFGGMAEAETVIEWGGELVSADRSLVLPEPIINERIFTWVWNKESMAISPGSAYAEQIFFGALQNTGGGNLSRARISHAVDVESGKAADFVEIRGNHINEKISGVIFFQPEVPFGSAVSFEEGGILQADIQYVNFNPREIRLAILNNGVWYLSKRRQTGASKLTMEDPAYELWGEWKLEDAAPFSEIPEIFDVEGNTFTHIEGIGIYFSAEGNHKDGVARFELRGFKADAKITPPTR